MKSKLKIVQDMIKTKIDVNATIFNSLSEEGKKIHLGRKYFIYDNISIYIIISICAGSYLAGLLNFVGVPPEINGIILALPVLAGLFQIIGAVISHNIHSQKHFVLYGIAIHRICLSIVFIYPLIFGPTFLCAVLVVITFALGNLIGASVGPAAASWIVSLVPDDVRGDYFSKRERYSLFGIVFATIIVSFVLDQSKIFDKLALGFAIVGIFLVAVAIFDIIHVAKIYEPKSEFVKQKFKLFSLIEPLLDKKFFKVIVVFLLWQSSAQIAIPYLGVYFINDIKMDYAIIGIVTIICTLEKAFVVGIWGKFADKTSWDYVLKIAILIYAITQLLLIFLSPYNYMWLFPAVSICSNIAWSILGIAFFNIQFQFANKEKTTMYIGVCGAVSGLFGFGVALIGSKILSTVNSMHLPFNGYQVLLLLSALIGFVLSFFMHKKVRKVE